MIRRSIAATLAVLAVASLVGSCSSPPADASKESTRDGQGQLVVPKPGLPGQAGSYMGY
jgi:hypothetical protein